MRSGEGRVPCRRESGSRLVRPRLSARFCFQAWASAPQPTLRAPPIAYPLRNPPHHRIAIGTTEQIRQHSAGAGICAPLINLRHNVASMLHTIGRLPIHCSPDMPICPTKKRQSYTRSFWNGGSATSGTIARSTDSALRYGPSRQRRAPHAFRPLCSVVIGACLHADAVFAHDRRLARHTPLA